MPRLRSRKVKGPKRVTYKLIDPTSDVGKPIYRLLRELVDANHEDIVDARIVLAWCTSWKPDVDGRVKLGMCKKASDLDREMAPYDFVILLKQSFWNDMNLLPDQERATLQKKALLDHELCHAAVKYDERSGEPVRDERGRKVYRMRKHDVEEFSAIVSRYGVWKRDLEEFAAAMNRHARGGWQPCADCKDTPNPGWRADAKGVLSRCGCWTSWSERNREAVPA